MALLSVRDLSIEYALEHLTIHAAQSVRFDLGAGRKLGLVGESGSGKTTIANALIGMIKPPGRVRSGQALLDGEDLLALSPEAMRRRRLRVVSYIPQGAMNSLNPVQRVRESLLDGMIDHGEAMGRAEARERVAELLAQVGLHPAVAARYPHELSGGMKQRVCIAAAIALRPRLLIADEPTSALDVITQRQIMETLEAVQGALGSGIILIGHDMGLMAQFADELMVLRGGRVEDHGPTARVFSAPASAYTERLITAIPTIGRRPAAAAAPAAMRPALRPAPARALLAIEGASKVYGRGLFSRGVDALRPVSLVLEEGAPRIVSIVGQSGSGKTTLGSLVLGFEAPSGGTVRFAGAPVPVGRMDRAFRRAVQAIPQDPYSAFNPFYTVDHAFTVPLLRFGIAAGRREAYERMGEAVRQVGLEPRAVHGRHAHQLSGGQRQRLMVARAISLGPRLIVADEPVSMVDASLRAGILRAIAALRDERGISVLYITHDLATAYAYSDYVLVLHRGRVVEAGPSAVVITDPEHPYTRLLVGSIPWPDPARAWADGRRVAQDAAAAEGAYAEGQPTVLRGEVPGVRFAA